MKRKDFLAMLEAAGVHPAKVTMKRDGTIELRKGFFYRHGMTCRQWGIQIINALPNLTLVGTTEEWRDWPGDSYFVAVVTVPA